MKAIKESVRVIRVGKAISELLGQKVRVTLLPKSTHSAADAAKSLSCEVAQIASSLVFQKKSDDAAVFVLTSGANKVNQKAIKKLCGGHIRMASKEFLAEEMGFEPGGVAPLGHLNKVPFYFVDKSLFEFPTVWAAAGENGAVFQLTQADLKRVVKYNEATVIDVTNGNVIELEDICTFR